MSKSIAVTQMVLHNINVPRVLCDHMLGEHHTARHRMLTGTFVMIIGVMIAKIAAHTHYEIVEIAGDLAGYLVHGVGLYLTWTR